MSEGAAKLPYRERVWRLVAHIEYGRVTTYGRIAEMLGAPRTARMVGWAMAAIPDEVDIPAHRVVNYRGELSGGWAFGHPLVMRDLLEDEGVPFVAEFQVDLARCLWEPDLSQIEKYLSQPPPTK